MPEIGLTNVTALLVGTGGLALALWLAWRLPTGVLLLALAASGLNGQNFAFVGYLPQDAAERIQRIRELESLALKTGQTQLFIETPYRNAALWQALLHALQHNTRLSISSGLTLAQSQTHSRSVKAWRQHPALPGGGLPAVFALGR